MPKKRPPVLEKVKGLLMKTSLSTVKLMKPISLNLIFYSKKKSSITLLRHYDNNYGGYSEEHDQCSPCSTPLIWKQKRKQKKKKSGNLYSMLLMCWCLGNFHEGTAVEVSCYSMETLPPLPPPTVEDDGITSLSREKDKEAEMSDDEETGFLSVDEMAERFIENFYQQIRMQREESCLVNM